MCVCVCVREREREREREIERERDFFFFWTCIILFFVKCFVLSEGQAVYLIKMFLIFTIIILLLDAW